MEFFFVALCYLAILMGVMCAVTWWLEEGRYGFRAKQQLRKKKNARRAGTQSEHHKKYCTYTVTKREGSVK